MPPLPPPAPELLPAAVQAALRAWYDLTAPPAPELERLLLVRERYRALDAAASLPLKRRAVNEIILSLLEELEAIDARGARVLRLHYLQGEITRAIGTQLHLGHDQVNRLQANAIRRLSELLAAREERLRDERASDLKAALPPAQYQTLRGVESLVDRLCDQLVQASSTSIVVVNGLGGIGKTALAHGIARSVIQHFHFERLIWIRYRAEPVAADPARSAFDTVLGDLARALGLDDPRTASARHDRVRETLKARPHLVIIDNLETEAELAPLLEQLPDFAGPSKFLLTSRVQPPAMATNVYGISISELPLADATALMLDQGRNNGLETESAIAEPDAEMIYRVVGGNPLALKLVVSLARIQPLASLLEDLSQSRTRETGGLYRHIYQRAWGSLSPPARLFLQSMPLVAEGGALPEHLLAISGLTEAQLWAAINELWSRSLLEVRGTLNEKRYGIHRLTETFLRTEIIRWPEEAAP